MSNIIVIGSIYLDMNCHDVPFSADGLLPETETVNSQYDILPGGSAINFARTCRGLGMKSQLIGKIGDDTTGRIVADLLQQADIENHLIVDPVAQTNLGLNFSNATQQTIMVASGSANQALESKELTAHLKDLLEPQSYLYIGGIFKLQNLLSDLGEIIHIAQQAGATVVLDHGRIPKDTSEAVRTAVRTCAKAVDIYLPSRDEFLELWGYASIEVGLTAIQSETNASVIVKDGANGAVTLGNGSLMSQPAFSVVPVHTIGAGDSFNAGFIAAHAAGSATETCLRSGCATAAVQIAQLTPPTRAQIDQLLTSNPSLL
jgi:sugar/nucleoside kinase (ribokinase family)